MRFDRRDNSGQTGVGGDDYYQRAIEAFSQSIRVASNEALAFVGRSAAKLGQLRRNGAAGQPMTVDRIAELQKLTRDDFIMAKPPDPNDPNVCRACIEYFESVGDYQTLSQYEAKNFFSLDGDYPGLAERAVSAKIAIGDLSGAIHDIDEAIQVGMRIGRVTYQTSGAAGAKGSRANRQTRLISHRPGDLRSEIRRSHGPVHPPIGVSRQGREITTTGRSTAGMPATSRCSRRSRCGGEIRQGPRLAILSGTILARRGHLEDALEQFKAFHKELREGNVASSDPRPLDVDIDSS